RLRVCQRIPDYAVVAMEEYVKNVPTFVTKLNPAGNVEKALSYIKMISNNPRFAIGPYHLPILAIVTVNHVYPRTARLIRREPFFSLIGVTAGWLSDNGKQALANLILSPREEK